MRVNAEHFVPQTTPLLVQASALWEEHASHMCPAVPARHRSLQWEGDEDRCPTARGAEEKRQLGEAWQYHLVGAASHRQGRREKRGQRAEK